MKVKVNNSVKELKEKVKIFKVGMDSGAYTMFRMNENTMRVFVPFSIDGTVKNWKTNHATNQTLLTVYTPFRYHSGGTYEILTEANGTVDVPVSNVVNIENGIVIDMTIPGDIFGGIIIIKNLLTTNFN